MKKYISLLLALVICLSFSVSVAAVSSDEVISVRSSLQEYECSVEQNFGLFYERSDMMFIENGSLQYLVEKDREENSYDVIPSDGFITVSHRGSEEDHEIRIGLRIYTKESSSKYVARQKNYGNQGLTLRACGFEHSLVSPDISDAYKPVILRAGESATISAADLLAAAAYPDQQPQPDKTYLFRITFYRDDPHTEEACGDYYVVIDDNAAAAITARGKAADPGNPFSDVPKAAYYHDPVLWALKEDITIGTSKTTFSPTATCTRGQVATFLWRAKGCPEPTTTENPFRDVTESDYFYKAILWAYENGITNGASVTTFDPAGTCTSAHVVTFLWRANGKPAADHSGTEYYAEAVAWAKENGLLTGTDTVFSPNNLSPRADIVTYLYRDMAN